MDYSEIIRLNRLLPELETRPANLIDAGRTALPPGLLTYAEQDRFNYAYNNPTFGWEAANTLLKAGVDRFPCWPSNSCAWIHRAWLLMRYRSHYEHDPRFAPVLQALQIFSHPRNTGMRATIEAALVTHEETPFRLGARLGMPGLTVEAYDSLFFNVHDRKADFMFLRNVVYPDTRLEEYMEDYLSRGNLSKQLLRIGFNKDLAAVLFFAGFRIDLAPGMTTQAATETLKKTILIQGHLLADNGFLPFTKQHVAILGAKNIITSGMIGGTDTGGETQGDLLGNVMHMELGRVRDALKLDVADRS